MSSQIIELSKRVPRGSYEDPKSRMGFYSFVEKFREVIGYLWDIEEDNLEDIIDVVDENRVELESMLLELHNCKNFFLELRDELRKEGTSSLKKVLLCF